LGVNEHYYINRCLTDDDANGIIPLLNDAFNKIGSGAFFKIVGGVSKIGTIIVQLRQNLQNCTEIQPDLARL
jgi:hypothetical protein